jgi:hypothetical protein
MYMQSTCTASNGRELQNNGRQPNVTRSSHCYCSTLEMNIIRVGCLRGNRGRQQAAAMVRALVEFRSSVERGTTKAKQTAAASRRRVLHYEL